MKLPVLLLAAAFGAGSAYAQAPDHKHENAPAKVQKKKVSAKKKAAKHQHHAAQHRNMGAMGAGPASPVTDLDASARQARIDQAYANWRARQR